MRIWLIMPSEDVKETLLMESLFDSFFVSNVGLNDLSHCVF
ncbi:hypothetical protein NitYY0918_C0298 [Nitratiruptor sp. YY09-18]|nr:hypothetical protein NitYY0918_C0298 [Nitratiruptor sp. YY09-18]